MEWPTTAPDVARSCAIYTRAHREIAGLIENYLAAASLFTDPFRKDENRRTIFQQQTKKINKTQNEPDHLNLRKKIIQENLQ